MNNENCCLIVERNSDMGIANILSVADQNVAFLYVFADNEAREASFRSVIHRVVQLYMPATSNRLEYCKLVLANSEAIQSNACTADV